MSEKYVKLDAEAYESLKSEVETLKRRLGELELATKPEPARVAKQKALFAVVTKIRESLVTKKVQTVWQDDYLQKTSGGRYRNHEIFAVDDIYKIGHTHCHVKVLEQIQAKAYCIAPVFVGENLWGLLAAYQNSGSRHWESGEVSLLAQIGSQLGVAMHQAELLDRTKQQSLELRTTLADLNTIVDNLADGLLVTDIEGKITRFNPALLAMFEVKDFDLKGKKVAEIFPRKLAELVEATEHREGEIVTLEVELGNHKKRFFTHAAAGISRSRSHDSSCDQSALECSQVYAVGFCYL